MPDSPGRVVQSRISCGAAGGTAEACLDVGGAAWARITAHDGGWTPWVLVGAAVVDVDVAATAGGPVVALVVTVPKSSDGRSLHEVLEDGSVVGTGL
jgi:hypothetical protein